MFDDLIIEKKFVDGGDWLPILDVVHELNRLQAYYNDPGLLIFAGSRFRTPWAFYRVSNRRTREAVLAGTLEARN